MPEYLHHRPRYHIAQAVGYLNDPNGPIEVDGTTHVYFQSRQFADVSVPVDWGHATSRDLVRWTVHHTAMSPTVGGLDTDGCWSGNTLITDAGIRAFFSGHDEGRPLERFLTALSSDGGMTFGRPELMLPDPDGSEDVGMLRDPFVWRSDHGIEMVAGSIVDNRAALRLYRLDEHSSWQYVGELASMERARVRGIDTGEGWECPQLIRVDDQEIALVGSWSFADGPSDVLAFQVDAPSDFELFDHGDSFYAPSVMRESSHGPAVFGWLRETREVEWWQQAGWAGAISLPRRVWLENAPAGVSARSEPIPALAGLRLGPSSSAYDTVVDAQCEVVCGPLTRRVRVRFGADEWLDIELDPVANALSIDRAKASHDGRAERRAIVIPDAFDAESARPAARILIDGSVVEVFTSAGRSATTRIYPVTAPPWRITGDDVQVWHLDGAVTAGSRLTTTYQQVEEGVRVGGE